LTEGPGVCLVFHEACFHRQAVLSSQHLAISR
jgi:hypothetical protein